MSKILVGLVIAASAIGAPALSFAQSNAPLTRAEVLADLVRFQEAGYNPSRGNDPYYPANVQAAQATIAAQKTQQQGTQGVGGVAQNGSASSGAPQPMPMHSTCEGPVSFCNVYFGS